MIDSLFFDSDCISVFLWVKKQNLLTLLYPGKIMIPKPAYIDDWLDVFCKPKFPSFAKAIPQAQGREFLSSHKRTAKSPACPIKDQQMAVMHQPVNQGGGHLGIIEDVDPFAELQVGGNDDAMSFIAV